MADYVLCAVADGIATITLNRPEAGNALNKALLLDFRDCLHRLAADDTVDAVIITGAGRMFCAGADLKGLASPQDAGEQVDLCLEVFDLLERLPQPTIAAINGYAVTGGVEMICACDIRIASEKAAFADTHARVGLVPGGGNSQKLPRLIGLGRAKEMLFTCDFLPAQEAAQIGLVNRVVPADQLLSTARGIAEKIRANNASTIRKIKRMVNQGWQGDLHHGLSVEATAFQRDLRYGVLSSFADRRPNVMSRNRDTAADKADRQLVSQD